MNVYKRDHAGEEPPLTVSERARLRELEKEVRDLRMEKGFFELDGAGHDLRVTGS